MAITFDVAASGNALGASSLTYSHTVGVGANTIIVAQPAIVDAVAGTASISSITYATVGLTVVPSSTQVFIFFAGLFDGIVAHYGLVAPATGANDVVVTVSEACDGVLCGTQSWFGVRQTASFGTAAIATDTTATPTVDVTSAAGEFVMGVALTIDDLGAFASADTEQWEQLGGAGQVVGGGASQVGAATVTMNWTGATDTAGWGVSGVSLRSFVMSLFTPARTDGVGHGGLFLGGRL